MSQFTLPQGGARATHPVLYETAAATATFFRNRNLGIENMRQQPAGLQASTSQFSVSLNTTPEFPDPPLSAVPYKFPAPSAITPTGVAPSE
jgi:hypothetical protein